MVRKLTIKTIKEIIRGIFPGWKKFTIIFGKRPTLKPILVKSWNTNLKTPIKRQSRSHTKEWESKGHRTSQRQPQKAGQPGGMPAEFWRKPFSAYNPVNRMISSKLPFLRDPLEDVLQQMEDTGARKVKTQHRRAGKDSPGRQQRAAQTKLLRLENEAEWLQQVWFQGKRRGQLIISHILGKYLKKI